MSKLLPKRKTEKSNRIVSSQRQPFTSKTEALNLLPQGTMLSVVKTRKVVKQTMQKNKPFI